MSTTDDVLALSAKSCVVHPLVLLSIQDHFHRVAKNTRKRVVGILLGQDLGPKGYNVANSFAGAPSSPLSRGVRVAALARAAPTSRETED
mgnify:CR=1 FL=1